VSHSTIQRWLDAWGYQADEGLYFSSAEVHALHAYRKEVQELLNPEGLIHASAVFDVDGVPTVCFIEDDGTLAEDAIALDRIREKIWNQNLISVVLVVGEDNALAVPVNRQELQPELVKFSQASESGIYSQRDLQSGDVFRRHPAWFAPDERVDHDLLRNLRRMVEELVDVGIRKPDAQYLMAQVLFISYLECRNIIGDKYRAKHQIGRLGELVSAHDRTGITRLLTQLKEDFNGDFLESETGGYLLWNELQDEALTRLDQFLSRTDLETGQKSFWHYDFRFIPVELISGIYESFLSEEKSEVGAYYTPRNLANFVVDQAFINSENILEEYIYDGACGSGILLTTAYRRMLSFAESRQGSPLHFNERRKLLEEHIFGSDLNESACRVTVFSLYLSMLEGLQPADIAELQDNDNVKLPSLGEKNIVGGAKRGDFFSKDNPHASGHRFTLFLSNPPWVEPKKDQVLSSDHWANVQKIKIPRRQTAGAFMLRARECLAPNGQVCMILPVSILAAPTSKKFLKLWLDHYRLDKLINFGDLRKLLFSTAKSPGMVLTARPRPDVSIGQIPGEETFEYWVPKADISFAFGRLTLHGSDRNTLQTTALQQDQELLTTLFWGSERDVATITTLRLNGTLVDLIGRKGSCPARKGFHRKDSSIDDPVSTKPLRNMPFLNAKQLAVDGPILDQSLLSSFPEEIETAARLPDNLMAAFAGPKIIFTDGVSNTRQIRAAFSNKAFSFTSSIGVIGGSPSDEPLLRFVATYLHSNLAQYVLLLTAYQLNFDRERISLTDIKKLPFVHPDQHTDSIRAWEIVHAIADLTYQEDNQELLRQPFDMSKCNTLIMEYFGLTRAERSRVKEVTDNIAPYLQPGSVIGLATPLQKRPTNNQINGFTAALHNEFDVWRKKRGGIGDISITVSVDSQKQCGPLGIVRIEPAIRDKKEGASKVVTASDSQLVNTLLTRLNQEGLLPLVLQRNLQLATDAVIRKGDVIYLVKPLLSRFWLRSEAYRDAKRIVRFILSSNTNREV